MNSLSLSEAAAHGDAALTIGDYLLWGALPYVTFAILVVGVFWRWRTDKFGWTSRSSLLMESKIMRVASPLFHLGILTVAMGHFVGLLIPEAWTTALGIQEDAYHAGAVVLSAIAGFGTLVGITLLVFRRRTAKRVFAATTTNDKIMYIFLLTAIILGLIASMKGAGVIGESHNYREDVSVWYRSLYFFQPEISHMADAPFQFRFHAISAMVLFAVWPFTRLVHAFSVPVPYFLRPYVVYRKRGRSRTGMRSAQRGWDKPL